MTRPDPVTPDTPPAEIILEANELAREFYRLHGYQVREGYRFDKARHLQEQLMWRLAEAAYEHLRATELCEVLDEIEDVP